MTSETGARTAIRGPMLGRWLNVEVPGATADTIGLEVVDHAGHRWRLAEANGLDTAEADIAEAPPWSRLSGPPGAVFVIADLDPIQATVTALVDGHRVRETHEIRPTGESVSLARVDEGDFVGLLAAPTVPGPGVVLLGGSEGGLNGALPTALALADRGWWCLVTGYLVVPGTPSILSEVPIEPVLAALDWLGGHDSVVDDQVALWGASKGAELALVVAACSPRVAGVVSVSGSPVVFEGLDPRARTSSWTYAGTPIPHQSMRRLRAAVAFGLRRRGPVTLRPIYGRGARTVIRRGAGTEHLANIDVPVLMIAGEQDQFWPASAMAEAAAYHPRFEALHLPHAGHLVQVPGLPPVTQVGARPLLRAGGDLRLAAEDHDRAWDATLVFLRGLSRTH